MESFTATVAIDPAPGGKRFQGVWLDHGGERWVIDYRARALWTPFEGLTVAVTGSRYEPVGQAITAVHFRVETLAVADLDQARRFRRIGPEHPLTGTFSAWSGEVRSKSEGMEVPAATTSGPHLWIVEAVPTWT